jgi:hypothetical protein
MIPKYSRENLPNGTWFFYKKTNPIKVTRIIGSFSVVTREGVLTCEDGYLAIDSDGFPYPIACDEFENIHEKDYGGFTETLRAANSSQVESIYKGLDKLLDDWRTRSEGIRITRGAEDPGYKAIRSCIKDLDYFIKNESVKNITKGRVSMV